MTKYGLAPEGEGWIAVNERDIHWRDTGPLGVYCSFEGKRRFPQLGINVNVLQPGQRLSMYHRENAQEGFLVVAGTCLLIVEGEERQLRTWDFFHCAPRTEHVVVGAGDSPAAGVAVGARGRGRKGIVYPVAEAASKHSACVERETTEPSEAYAGRPRARCVYRDGWLPEL